MAKPGSPNPDYDEKNFPDERSMFVHVFHDRRDEGRRNTPSEYNLPAKERAQLEHERLVESGRDPETQRDDWADKMMSAQDAEEGGLEQQRGKPRY
jgi:hypothetical protein